MKMAVYEPMFGAYIGELEVHTHGPEDCLRVNEHCMIHDPSDHPLKDAPIAWRQDRRLFERTCKHGIGHPDPDDLAFKREVMSEAAYNGHAFGLHGCDGCCDHDSVIYKMNAEREGI